MLLEQLKENKEMDRLTIGCQERYKFLENPEGYLKELHAWSRDLKKKLIRPRKFFEPQFAYRNYVEHQIAAIEGVYTEAMRKVKADAAEYTKMTYVYYKGAKLAVPNDFYSSYKDADVVAYLNYLEAEDAKKHIVTDEDREKARLLDCNMDYNYLQTLLNKISNNKDLVISIRTKDGATIVLKSVAKESNDDLSTGELFIEPEMIH